MWNHIFRALALVLAMATPVAAATIDVVIIDSSGKPVANAVVAFTPDTGTLAMRTPATARVDQHHESFVPLVVVVRKGGEVTFTNSDPTMHQVYSFSGVKQFQMEVEKGQTSKPVIFEKPGVAAVGCNIHDKMIMHVVVTEAPLAVVTDASGRAQIRDVPDGAYHATVWHKQLPTGKPLASIPFAVLEGSRFANTLPFKVVSPNAATRMHMDY